MGQFVSDTHVALHGEGTTGHTPKVRLHWGNESIDETHEAPFASVWYWRSLVVAADWTALGQSFADWMDDVGASSAAKAKKAQFTQSLRYALGG